MKNKHCNTAHRELFIHPIEKTLDTYFFQKARTSSTLEQSAVRYIIQGLISKEDAARALNVSEETLDSHLRAYFQNHPDAFTDPSALNALNLEIQDCFVNRKDFVGHTIQEILKHEDAQKKRAITQSSTN